MKYLPVVAAAASASVLLAVTSWVGVMALTAAVCLLCVVVALGWPQLMGVTARKSLSVVILTAGIVAAVGAAVVERVQSLFFWSTVALAFGVMVVFVLQVLRGSDRPYRLESTLGACAGVVVTTTAAGWVAGLRYPASLAGTEDDAGVALLRVRGLLPYEDFALLAVTGQGGEISVVGLAALALLAGTVAACLPWRDAVVLPVVVVVTCAASVGAAVLWGEVTLLFAGVLGLAAGALMASFRRFVVLHGPPEGVLSALAVGTAPIAAMGGLVYFTERLLFM
ncbi:hypothetical protein [Nesterenkonia alba]|uniref:hypothetical protein n=1 Tax=Nesterenkonia alba TaxID=515814 RepID=UPI0003B4E4A7|nr:hypothetical protein [Nesterenkonia alba]